MSKCLVRHDVIEPCKHLREAVTSSGDKFIGLHEIVVPDPHSGRTVSSYMRLNLGKHRPRGMVMSWCPFCGQPIGSTAPGRQR